MPYPKAIELSMFPDKLKHKEWFGNLEGSIVDAGKIEQMRNKKVVFNSNIAIGALVKELNFRAFNLANNHILDAATIDKTILCLSDFGLKYCGAGINIYDAESSEYVNESEKYVVLSCGWSAINCIYASANTQGVSPYSKSSVLNRASTALRKYSGYRIVFYFHWNYELELYPQPLDRDIAHKLIDMGVYAVIGCHAHRVQPIEFYKDRPIVYGLGNFLFKQKYYMQGRLEFPNFTHIEYAFELNGEGFELHRFMYNQDSDRLTYIDSISEFIQPDFSMLDSKEYELWFKNNRYQRKLLPIFYYSDSNICNYFKLKFVKIRGKIVNLLGKNKVIYVTIKKIFN